MAAIPGQARVPVGNEELVLESQSLSVRILGSGWSCHQPWAFPHSLPNLPFRLSKWHHPGLSPHAHPPSDSFNETRLRRQEGHEATLLQPASGFGIATSLARCPAPSSAPTQALRKTTTPSMHLGCPPAALPPSRREACWEL